MWSLVFRMALMASALAVAWNFARAWIGTLGVQKRPPDLPAASHAEIAARVLATEATRHVIAIEVAIAGLADSGLWEATAQFTRAATRLKQAMLAEPDHYRRARRHLGQILIAAEQTIKHFARHYAAMPNPGTRRRFLALLDELAGAFDRAAEHYASAGEAELDIEAATLKVLLRRGPR